VKKLLISTVVGVVVLFVIAPRFVRWASTRQIAPIGTAGLRLGVLQRKFVDTSAATAPDDVQAVVMDWNMGAGTIATLVAYTDGKTSLYISPGKVINGGDRESVREAASRFLAAAADRSDQFSKTIEFDPPPNKEVRFYIITKTGTLGTLKLLDGTLANETYPLHKLSEAGKATIAELQN
jgi:hypothetical protein